MADRSRRSFFADLLTTVAGGWVTVTGLVTAASALGGCGDDSVTPKYGGPNPDLGPVAKYGGDGGYPDATKYGGQVDLGPVVKYGGNDAGGYQDGMATKYGGKVDLGPVVKYGGTDGGYKDGMTVKYGGFPDAAVTTKYGGFPG